MLKYFLYTQSGWQDSNLRPPRPKRGAMTGLRYTPSLYTAMLLGKFREALHKVCWIENCGEEGIRTPGTRKGTTP